MKIKEIQVTRYILVSDDETHQYGDVQYIERASAELAMNSIKRQAALIAEKQGIEL